MTDRPNSFPGDAASREAEGGLLPAMSPGKPKRNVPPRLAVTVALLQAELSGSPVRCAICSNHLTHAQARILEHMTPRATLIALGQPPDVLDNLRWVHKGCADRKTNGTPATSAGSDKHMEAKGKRLARAQEVHRAVLAGTHKREPSRIKSRGFDKTRTRTFGGKVVSRG